MLRLKVPKLKNPNVVFRLAASIEEIENADQLVLKNYMGVGLWSDNNELVQNKHLRAPLRTCLVAMDSEHMLATVSIVKDSSYGLPADKFQPHAMKRIRAWGDHLAEVSALAVDRCANQCSEIILFLFAYLTQYSFFYSDIDRFIISTTEKHARFYRSVFGFQVFSEPTQHYYVKVKGQLLTVHLLCDRIALAKNYGIDPVSRKPGAYEFYDFLLTTNHKCFRFPERHLMRRQRDHDWLARARCVQMPIAV